MKLLEIEKQYQKEYFTGWDWDRSDIIGKMINELEGVANEFILSEAQKLKNYQSFSKPWDNII